MTLLICPVRPGDNNEELRYALRSWETNLVLPGGLDLMTVGHKPHWLEPDWHVAGNRFDSAALNVWDNVMLASAVAKEEYFGHALYMNDDFFCLDLVTDVPVYRRDKTLAQHRAMLPGGEHQWFPRSLDLTASWLAEQGYPHPDSYDLHRPLLAHPGRMVSALSRWGEPEEGSEVPQWRTIYGVLNEIAAHPVPDVKISREITGFGTPWISTDDRTWRTLRLGMMQRFQKPSCWEI